MFSGKKQKFALWFHLLIAVITWVRVPVRQIDVSIVEMNRQCDAGIVCHLDLLVADNKAVMREDKMGDGDFGFRPAFPQWSRAWFWELGDQTDGSRLELTAAGLRWRVCIMLALLISLLCLLARDRILIPIFVIGSACFARIVFVPCTWEVHIGNTARVALRATTIPLWQVTTQDIRYGLVGFEELVLLLAILIYYALASSGTMKYSVLRSWRVPRS